MMLNRLAFAISVIFHPLLMPTYLVGIIIYASKPFYWSGYIQIEQLDIQIPAKIVMLSFTFIMTFLIPFISIILLKFWGLTGGYLMKAKKDRIVPILLTIVALSYTYLNLRSLSVHPSVSYIILAAVISLVFAFIINLKWKISLHSIGVGGALGILFYFVPLAGKPMLGIILLAIIIAGLVGSARLYLGEHRPIQIYTGYLVGLLGSIIALSF